jgi:hypothetical protein
VPGIIAWQTAWYDTGKNAVADPSKNSVRLLCASVNSTSACRPPTWPAPPRLSSRRSLRRGAPVEVEHEYFS